MKLTYFHFIFVTYIVVSRAEHSANPDKFAHVLQQSRWRSPMPVVVRYRYLYMLRMMDMDLSDERRSSHSKDRTITD